ncbi:MAG: chemotaxis protein CheW [Thermostichus sp. DG02_5_bins_236]
MMPSPLRAPTETAVGPPERSELLSLRAAGDLTFGIPLQQARQVLEIPKEMILPVPDMPDAVLGVCRFQEKLLWLVDLATLVGSEAKANWDLVTHVTVVTLEMLFAGQTQWLGLAIEKLEDILEVNTNELSPVSNHSISASLQPYVRSRWQSPSSKGSLWILDGLSILRVLKAPGSPLLP